MDFDNTAIKKFADEHKLKTRLDGCDETIIPGRVWKKQPGANRLNRKPDYGHHIYDHGDGKQFGICLMYESASPAKWTNAKKVMIAAGFTIRQNRGEKSSVPEGTAVFDPTNRAQVRLAIKLAGCRIRRKLPPEQAKMLADRLTAARQAKMTPVA